MTFILNAPKLMEIKSFRSSVGIKQECLFQAINVFWSKINMLLH